MQVLWYGGENAEQDVRICLESNDHALAHVMMHSSRLISCSSSSYFAASLKEASKRKRKKKRKRNNPKEITVHVDDESDLQLYKDCFSRMYLPPIRVGNFKSVKYCLNLLPVATQLAYDDLVNSICLYLLVSVRPPRSLAVKLRIRSSMLSVGVPRDLLEMLEGLMTKEDLCPLVSECMKSLCSSAEAKVLFGRLLKAAGTVKERFEQDGIKEEFRLLRGQAYDEVEAADTLEKVHGAISKATTSQQVLEMLIAAGLAEEGVKWFHCMTIRDLMSMLTPKRP